jgi:hypothetical protein
MENRLGRTVRIKVGDVEVELKGHGDVDTVVALVERLKEDRAKKVIEP